MLGTVYLVATPIGNLQDISLRALEVLKTVDIVACEDTRHTGKLLKHFGIDKKLVSYHEHNEINRADEFAEFLRIGMSIAVVTDAGTPGICDPSFRIVKKAHEIDARVTAIPGATAFVNAIVISGLPTDSIFFGGFLPSRKSARRKRLDELADISATLCFYESPHRISKCLNDCLYVLGNRKAAVVRELTKLHEEVVVSSLSELAEHFGNEKTKGEIVLIIDRNKPENPTVDDSKTVAERIKELQQKGLDHKKALKKAAKEFGINRSEAYRIYQEKRGT